jgi:hypothetical protein
VRVSTLQKLALTAWLTTTALAQQPQTPPPDQKTAPSTEQKPMTLAEKRKADLQADTEKLYKLTQELKAEVDKSNKDTLSVAVVKKAQEVERLAKSIKERSKQQ